MAVDDGFKERISILIDDIGPKKLSDASGVSKSMLHRYKNGQDCSSSIVQKLLDVSGYSGLWLFHDVGPRKLDDIGKIDSQDGSGFIEIKSLNENQNNELTFDSNYLKNFLKVEPENTKNLSVMDDCMYPLHKENDLVLIDISRKSGSGVFAIQIGEEITLRQLSILINGNIELKCENKKYPTSELTPKEFEKINVLGRLVWSGGKS